MQVYKQVKNKSSSWKDLGRWFIRELNLHWLRT